jgi:hypothetical protein
MPFALTLTSGSDVVPITLSMGVAGDLDLGSRGIDRARTFG